MNKFLALAGAAALGLGFQTAAHAYSATATVTFAIGGTPTGTSGWGTPLNSPPGTASTLTPGGGPAEDHGWTNNGTNQMSSMSNSTYFTILSGYNSRSFYNADFVPNLSPSCDIGGSIVPATATLVTGARKYGCRFNNAVGDPSFNANAVADAGPNATATGTVTVTDTTLTGTLTVISTTNEPTGGTAGTVGNGTNGYNYRTADGSPFGNAWYGLTTAGTYSLAATGTFTPTSWTIDHATALYFDAGYLCAQGGNSSPANILCATTSTVAGGHQGKGQDLSWGWDQDGNGTGTTAITELLFTTPSGTDVSLSGLVAVLAVNGSGTISTTTGEYRRGLSGAACAPGPFNPSAGGKMQWDGTRVSCGTFSAGMVNITGTATVVPAPAAFWLLASGVGVLVGRRKFAKTA